MPTQNDFNNCGVFVCAYADHLARRAAMAFTSQDMPRMRVTIAREICQGALMEHPKFEHQLVREPMLESLQMQESDVSS